MLIKIIIVFSLLINISFANVVHNFFLTELTSKKTFALESVLGKKVIVLNFFASWCTSCIIEMPELPELKAKNKNAIFIGINAGERVKIIKKFLKRYKFNYIILLDNDRIISKKYGVTNLPRTIIISKSQKIVFDGERPPHDIKKNWYK